MAATPKPHRNSFYDPAAGYQYDWSQNHSEEQGGTRTRSVTNDHPSGARWRAIRAIRTQGYFDEAVLKLAGLAPTLAQHKAFLHFADLSTRQTIYFLHAAGEAWECLLSEYAPQREYLIQGPKGEKWVWPYTLQIDVIQPLDL